VFWQPVSEHWAHLVLNSEGSRRGQQCTQGRPSWHFPFATEKMKWREALCRPREQGFNWGEGQQAERRGSLSPKLSPPLHQFSSSTSKPCYFPHSAELTGAATRCQVSAGPSDTRRDPGRGCRQSRTEERMSRDSTERHLTWDSPEILHQTMLPSEN